MTNHPIQRTKKESARLIPAWKHAEENKNCAQHKKAATNSSATKNSLEENTMNENNKARQNYDDQEVNKASINVLNRRENKVIDADAEHTAKIARQIRDRKAAARHQSPIMEAI